MSEMPEEPVPDPEDDEDIRDPEGEPDAYDEEDEYEAAGTISRDVLWLLGQ